MTRYISFTATVSDKTGKWKETMRYSEEQLCIFAMRNIISEFNKHLRTGEDPRELVDVVLDKQTKQSHE